ncbi:hypothetical protein B0H14DRAFT_2592171 [Mycena olivaceomarginata]|nr:hypothetical protein B0H14DRAFT_2592171 [Mycena olivaceomarginata]
MEAEEQGVTQDLNRCMYRHCERKSGKFEEQIEAYAEKYCIPIHIVRELVHEELISDEVLGPENKAIESPAAWKVRMAVEYGEKDVSPAALKDPSFLEVLEYIPGEYTTDEHPQLSELLRRIQELPGKSGNIQYKHVRGTLRKCSHIPLISPYNFGISCKWLEEQHQNPEAVLLLTDWGIHGNPKDFDGIGSEVGPTDESAAAGKRDVDLRFDFEGLADHDNS